MQRTLDEERERGGRAFTGAGSLDDLEAAKVSILGRKSPLAEVQRALGTLPAEVREDVGRRVNEARAELQAAFERRKVGLEREAEDVLRRKLDNLGPRLIHTLRGVGYVLRLPPEQ